MLGQAFNPSSILQDRLDTLANVQAAGISMCAGGIIGLGEGPKDRIGLIHQLATLPSHPESVPINSLVAIAGTPLEGLKSPTGLDMARCIATARITMPQSVVRLSAGRLKLSTSDQVITRLRYITTLMHTCALQGAPYILTKRLAYDFRVIKTAFPLDSKNRKSKVKETSIEMLSATMQAYGCLKGFDEAFLSSILADPGPSIEDNDLPCIIVDPTNQQRES